VFKLYYGLNGPTHSLGEIAGILGVSRTLVVYHRTTAQYDLRSEEVQARGIPEAVLDRLYRDQRTRYFRLMGL
jgi:hypothetical protein